MNFAARFGLCSTIALVSTCTLSVAQPTYWVTKETTLYRFKQGGPVKTFQLSDRIRGLGARSDGSLFAVSPVLPDNGEPEFYHIFNPFAAHVSLTPTDVQTVAFSSVTEVGNVLYGTGGPGNLYLIDPSNNYQPTLIGSTGLGDVGGLAYDALSGTLYALDNATDGLYPIDFGSGAAGPLIGTLGIDSDSCGIEFLNGTLYAAIQNITDDKFQIGIIDTSSGAFSPFFDLLDFAERSATGFALVPAPSGLALLGTAGLVLARRRRG